MKFERRNMQNSWERKKGRKRERKGERKRERKKEKKKKIPQTHSPQLLL